MTPDPEVAEALERLDRALTPTHILTAKAVAEFRNREQQPVPKINQHDNRGGRRLDVVAVVHASEPRHAPNVSEGRRRRTLLQRLFRRK